MEKESTSSGEALLAGVDGLWAEALLVRMPRRGWNAHTLMTPSALQQAGVSTGPGGLLRLVIKTSLPSPR